jgi:hypothetical protein
MSIDAMEALSVASHDEAAANLVDLLAASAGCSAQILERLSNPRAVQFAALARDLRCGPVSSGNGNRGRNLVCGWCGDLQALRDPLEQCLDPIKLRRLHGRPAGAS